MIYAVLACAGVHRQRSASGFWVLATRKLGLHTKNELIHMATTVVCARLLVTSAG